MTPLPDLLAELPSPLQSDPEALLWCRLRTAPDGSPRTFREGLNEWSEAASPSLRERVLARIAAHAPHPLPWVFLDIDGTLIPPGGHLSPGNRAAVRAYLAAGGRITLATGKHPRAIRALLADLAIPGIHAGLNGGVLAQDGEVQTLARLGPAAEVIPALIDERKLPYTLYTAEGIFAPSQDLTDWHFRVLLELLEPEPFRDRLPRSEEVVKILCFIHEDDEIQDRWMRAEAERLGTGCLRTGPHFLEFVPRGHGKESAVSVLLAQADWPSGHTVALGDTENDRGMLRRVGKAFVMGDGSPNLRRLADHVTAPCHEDGVAEVLRGLLVQPSVCAMPRR